MSLNYTARAAEILERLAARPDLTPAESIRLAAAYARLAQAETLRAWLPRLVEDVLERLPKPAPAATPTVPSNPLQALILRLRRLLRGIDNPGAAARDTYRTHAQCIKRGYEPPTIYQAIRETLVGHGVDVDTDVTLVEQVVVELDLYREDQVRQEMKQYGTRLCRVTSVLAQHGVTVHGDSSRPALRVLAASLITADEEDTADIAAAEDLVNQVAATLAEHGVRDPDGDGTPEAMRPYAAAICGVMAVALPDPVFAGCVTTVEYLLFRTSAVVRGSAYGDVARAVVAVLAAADGANA